MFLQGRIMGTITKPKFSTIVLCLILGVILITFQSCKIDQQGPENTNSLGISAVDNFPSWSPDGQNIVFQSNRDGNQEIYTMSADGSNPTRLTKNTDRDGMPSWSPDGSRIIFSSNRDGNWEVYVMNSDGSEQMRLSVIQTYDGMPSWSPDGTQIVFVSERDGNAEIYTMNADGSSPARLTDHPARDSSPSWSPDGQRIAFGSRRDGDWNIFTMNVDGTEQIRLTNESSNHRPCWSPDGSKIIFNSNRDGNWEIYTINADGSNPTRLTYNTTGDGVPSFSPDGQKILFGSNRDFDNEVYVMDADGSNPVNLTNNAPINATYGLEPLPQSELDLDAIPYKIVFETFRETDGKENWEICQIDADGSNLINLTKTPEIDEMYPHASPDGSRICFVADEGEDKESKIRRVFYMNIDGTARVKVADNAYHPCWSPDGKYIAYLPGEFPRYDLSSLATKGLEIYNVDTGEVRQHPNDEIIHINRICFSPDGKWFVAAQRGPNIAFQADGNIKMNLTTQGCTPDISPEGKQIAWNATDNFINIGTLDFNSPESNVTDHTIVIACEREYWVYHADWSPSGDFMTFSYFPNEGGDRPGMLAPGSNICICDLKTGKWTQITTDGKHNKEPDWVVVRDQ
jgi:Tol biopolymer transport system component